MDEKELFEKGVNDSLVHVDFMMGTEDLMIDGILEDGRGQETADTPCHRKAESFRAGSPALQNL